MSMTRGAKMLMIRNESRRGESGGRNEGESGGRNEMRGNYEEMRDEMESRFRDRRGREHYDNGRFAPMRGEMDEGTEMGYRDMRNETRGSYGEMRGEEMRGAEMRRGGSGGRSHYPFGPVPPVYERGSEMNQIGFVVPLGRSEVGSNYPNNAAYSATDEMEYKKQKSMRGGASGESMMLTEDMAHEWMHDLKNEDGTKGPHWNMEQIKQVMNQKGIKEDPLRFWVAMNASYSDLCGVAKKHGVNTMDYYIDYAKAFWFNDKDAVEDKLGAYFMNVVK